MTQLAKTFKDYPVTAIPVENNLHLKSFCSMAGDNTIAIGSSPTAQRAQQLISSKASFQYEFICVPDDIGANCLFVNGTLVRASCEVFPKSAAVYEEQLHCPQIPLSLSELNKVDGCLTCCSVLIP